MSPYFKVSSAIRYTGTLKAGPVRDEPYAGFFTGVTSSSSNTVSTLLPSIRTSTMVLSKPGPATVTRPVSPAYSSAAGDRPSSRTLIRSPTSILSLTTQPPHTATLKKVVLLYCKSYHSRSRYEEVSPRLLSFGGVLREAPPDFELIRKVVLGSSQQYFALRPRYR